MQSLVGLQSPPDTRMTPFQQYGGSSVVVFALRAQPPRVSTVLVLGGTLSLCETAKLLCGLKDVTTASIDTVLSGKQAEFKILVT